MSRRDNRKAILDSAEKLFLTRRFDQVTLDEVSKKAHVGKGTIYLHFEDKEDLYSEVFINGLDELEKLLLDVIAAESGHHDKLQEIATALRAFYDKRRTLFRLGSFHEFKRIVKNRKPNARLSEKHGAVLDIISNTIREGQEKGIYTSAIDPVVATRLLMAMLREGYFGKAETNGNPIELDAVIQVFTDGIRNNYGN